MARYEEATENGLGGVGLGTIGANEEDLHDVLLFL